MTKLSIAVLKREGSEDLEVLACSDDAQIVLDAFLECDEPGEVQFFRKVAYDKRKVNQAGTESPKTKKASKKSDKSE